MRFSKRELFDLGGKKVVAYNVANKNGYSVEILNLGCTMTKIMAPDKNGNIENILLACKDMKTYIENPSYMGALLGRTAGRICEGKITIEGVDYDLALNYGLHSGQGGEKGFNKKIWDVKVVENETSISLVCTTFSPDGDENYPGNVNAEVVFTFNEDNELRVEYKADTDKVTLVNMSQHNYFNLSGNIKRPVTDQYLIVNADSIMELDETSVPTGKYIDVTGTPFDFRSGKTVGQDINKDHIQLKIGNGYDHLWNLNKKKDYDVFIKDEESGRSMKITTTQKHVVIYSMNYANGPILYDGQPERVRHGICFETQKPPIGRNQVFLEDSILRPGEKYDQVTEYKFDIAK